MEITRDQALREALAQRAREAEAVTEHEKAERKARRAKRKAARLARRRSR